MIPDYFITCPEHTIAINLSIITSTQILEVFCKTKAEMPLSGIRATSEGLDLTAHL